MGLCIKGNNRSNGIVNRHLAETSANSFECFEEQVRSRQYHSMWDTEIEIKVEQLFRDGVYDPIYELLLQEKGSVEKWSKKWEEKYNIDWCDLFSDFQLHLYNMLDGIADKVYNRDISFMNNLYKQLECLTKDKRKYLNRAKRKYDWNSIPTDMYEQIPDKTDLYANSELLMDLQELNWTESTDIDRKIIIGLATDVIEKSEIPLQFNWAKNDRKKLSRYMQTTKILLADIITTI
ncbi:hypothetical protein [Clostridium lacusfryxellense]|uniref:hypothetical protein n=1 Tax=Clostridium lacusfryxellense TaxID=205328 RepID=UPI001C0E1A60|nr:hypothetical protein [Clostridium lacusfryxellense]MBU3113159.1 hypothetical protein [Clostridium lacusfryxellense]